MSEGLSFFLGFLFGAFALFGLSRSMLITWRRNMKEYLFTLSPEYRKVIEEDLERLYADVKELAVKTNTRLLKSLHNDLNDLKTYLEKLWQQN